MADLTEKQLQTLQQIAKDVTGNFQSLAIEEILNRIHFIANTDYKRSIEGLKRMLKYEFIRVPFVIGLERLDALSRVVDRTFPLMDVLDTQIVKSSEYDPGDGPKDDEPDEEDGWTTRPLNAIVKSGLDLSHIDANF